MANRLIGEQSPYLLQHAHNPVDWYPWSDEAFARASTENKPVIVSIGYSACHWCHVMERESFEDGQVAAFMNSNFVCIKVDREEHPDVDHLYMDAVQAISGNGGWPLNVFVTPGRAPFFGGTYYPPRPAYNRPSWMQLLQRMADIWTHRRDEVSLQSEQLISHLRQASQGVMNKQGEVPDTTMCRRIADSLLKQADKEKGGFGNAPKFPGTMAISFLLEHYRFTGHRPALEHALHSLDAMMEGGIYDQAGGGFARYATDRDWLVPHFEKMLYDNALLVPVYCDAYLLTKDERYRVIIEETIAFVETELKDPSGGYYCALDADSEGIEGKFYTWTWDEWVAALQENDRAVMDYFGVTPVGNWEATNILHIAKPIDEVAVRHGLTREELSKRILAVKNKLLRARSERIRPGTDDKCLLSWNALMNLALTRAGLALRENGGDVYLQKAGRHMKWMLAQFENDGELDHTWKNGKAKITAKLDDYAYLMQALLQLASATGENKWIVKAASFMEKAISGFGNSEGFFYYSHKNQEDIPVRKVELYDGATPSGNAVMAANLWMCGMCMERNDWIVMSREMVGKMGDVACRYSYSYGYWAQLLQRRAMGMNTVVCSGNEASEARGKIWSNFVPHTYLVTLGKEISEIPLLESKYFDGGMFIFVCSEESCLSPVSRVDQAIQLIEKS